MLKGAAAGAATLALSALGATRPGPASGRSSATPSGTAEPSAASPIAAASPASASPTPGGLIGYAFNAKTRDVTLFDPATRQVVATKPLGAVVRWLSNEQRFWDGRYIWTYDYPDDRVQAIAIDPQAVSVARTLPTGGVGPAHSLMLTPDGKTAWVNVAGDDFLAVFDVASGELAAQVKTGAFP